MNARWPMVAFCLIAIFTLRTDGHGGMGGGGGGFGGGGGGGFGPGGGGGIHGPGSGGGNSSNSRNLTPTLENAMGEAVWTGGAASDQPAQDYKPLTKDESAKATDDLRTAVKAIDDKLHMHFKDPATTEHTLVYSTAPSSAVSALSAKAEQAYATAMHAFGSQSKQVVLPGKLLIYILDRSSLYESFAKDNDSFEVPKGAVGYTFFPGDDTGTMHIVMGPPPDDLVDRSVKPITAWQAALVRATTFALVYRFHSNRAVPNWVIQGLADVAADSVLPQPYNRTRAYLLSQEKGFNIADVLNDKRTDFPSHSLMQTLTETLMIHDRAAYVKLLLALKDGKTSGDALQANYKWSFDELGTAWTAYVKQFAAKPQ